MFETSWCFPAFSTEADETTRLLWDCQAAGDDRMVNATMREHVLPTCHLT